MSIAISRNSLNREVSNVELRPQNLEKKEYNNVEMTLTFPSEQQKATVGEDIEQLTQEVKSTIDRTNEKLKIMRTRCEFSYHEDINRIAIRVIDEETKEVIREIPPEKTLEAVRKMWELVGLLVDERC